MLKSKLQRIATERNSAKWQLMGVHGGVNNLMGRCRKVLTDAEKEKLANAVRAIDDVLSWWDSSNSHFGLKSKSTTDKSSK